MSAKKASPLFGKINVYDPKEGKQRVEIYILINQPVEGMKVGIAVDASASMMPPFAANIPKAFRQPGQNQVEPIVKHLARFVSDYSGDGTVNIIYWAVGPQGKEIEPVGVLDKAAIDALEVDGPKEHPWGTGTHLVPALDYYLVEHKDAEWNIVLYITDGILEDMEEVKARCMAAGRETLDGSRKECKFVIVGVGSEVDEDQLDELDDMFDGTDLQEDVDLWDAKLAAEMSALEEIWEEVDFGITLPGAMHIKDDKGNEVLAYSDGFPQKLGFEVQEGTKTVTIEIAGQTIVQPLE